MERRPLRALLIDDDGVFLKLHQDLLQGEGWVCETASSGAEGIQKLASATPLPDVVVVDMSMPGMDGRQVVEVIRGRWPHLCVVVLTGSQSQRDIQIAIDTVKAGADDFWTKPIAPNSFGFKLELAYERKQIEEECKRLKEKEIKETKDILTMTRGFMHQISPRLNTAFLLLSDLEPQSKKGEKYDKVVRVRKNLEPAQRLVERFRKFPLDGIKEQQPIHLAKTVMGTLGYVQTMQSFTRGVLKELRISTDGEDNATRVMGDGALIEEAFINLFDNAFQAMTHRKKKELHVSIRDASEKTIVVEITDSGHGILPADRDDIFEPFFTTKDGRGMGLGLYFTKMVIEKHGGKITFKSKVEEGTTFMVTLPITSKTEKVL